MSAELNEIQAHLKRLNASEIWVSFDEQFEPDAGALLFVKSNDTYWHLLPEHFQTLLSDLPDGVGVSAIHEAIEASGPAVWHGPAPKNSRDTPN